MPGFPGAASRSPTDGDRASRHESACSRPPPPTTRTLNGSCGQRQALLASGTDADDADRNVDELGDALEIRARGLREVLGRACAGEVFGPAVELLVDRFGRMEQRLVRRHVLVRLTFGAVRRADLHRLEPGQDVELRDEQLGEAVDASGVSQYDRVEPPAPPLAPGHRPELVAALAEPLPVGVVLLGRERAGADARDVGLRDPD